ncbi:MAG: YfcC family protein [Clostridia bacterium]|nr:YfcC family protein [Clostridia bacterium]
MEDNSSLKIGKKAFITSVMILALLMVMAGALVYTIPSGQYDRVIENGREVLVPDSFKLIDKPDYPVWRVLTAPFEVLVSDDAATVIVIIAFIIIVGGVFALLEKSGILNQLLTNIVGRFAGRKYKLLAMITAVFMIFGSSFGLFEELVVLVPLAIALAYSLKWDSFVGLGCTVLAACFGFSATTLNPFTLATAQSIAGLPLYSGLWFRIIVLVLSYLILITFLTKYAKKIENEPKKSLCFGIDGDLRLKYDSILNLDLEATNERAMLAFYITLGIMGGFIVLSMFISALSGVLLPVIAIIFLIGSVVAAILSQKLKNVGKTLVSGMTSTLPGSILILMAMSVKLIIENGQVMDTILNYAAGYISQSSPFVSVLLIYALVLVLNFFIGSGSAKAFLIMPLLAPLCDLIGITRQTAVTAFCLGDGLTNVLYPTNAMLMITLGLTVISYPKWFKFTIKLQIVYAIFSCAVLLAAQYIGLGPF